MITVFYDGKYGLCSKEINLYRNIAPADLFDWQDITEYTDRLKDVGITPAEGLKLLHAKDKEGKLHVGVDAFILIWKQLKRWKVLAVLVSLPLIKQIAQVAYTAFAGWHFKRLAHFQLALKNEKNL